MPSLKISTPAGVLLTTGTLITSAVLANTYTTPIAIDYQTNTLNWTQKTPMQFATVVFNEKTANGQICHTHSNKKSNNTLCPGNRGGVKNSDYTITGTPNTTVKVNLNTSKTTLEGIEFTPILLGKGDIKLNKKGRANYDIGGQLLLIDGAATSSTSLTFSYELEFVSQ